ncbi:Na/Pi symporter [Pontibacillus marinus]|uniref:Na/Pi symporter n=1 Tax=Pontibacillus marinus TaxID=273164 RepID=UPI00048593DD
MTLADFLTLFAIYISIFLFGMTVLRIGLYQLSYRNMRQALQRFTSNPFKGMLMGVLVTGVLQSSSCTMVLTVGFVSVGLITFRQSIGIILGANIGTTVTAEIMTFYEQIPLWPLLIVGAIFLLFRKPIVFGAGAISFGLGTVFVALNGLETLAEPIKAFPVIQEALQTTDTYTSAGILLGTGLTAIIQSSTATTGIAMTFLNENLIGLSSAIAIMLGANIGTCITAWFASIGSNREAKLVALAHIWLNVLGVLVFAPFVHEMSSLAQWLTQDPLKQLAHISVLFNVVSSLIVLPVVTQFTNFVLWVHRKSG